MKTPGDFQNIISSSLFTDKSLGVARIFAGGELYCYLKPINLAPTNLFSRGVRLRPLHPLATPVITGIYRCSSFYLKLQLTDGDSQKGEQTISKA